MSTEENPPTDAPTRAIHDAYLELQGALKKYRRAEDAGNQRAITDAHGKVQDAVLTFYEMLRPHIREQSALDDYWKGQPPSYNHNGAPPDPEEGKGVLHVQRRHDTRQLNGHNPEELETLKDWHEALKMAENVRLTGINIEGEVVLTVYDAFQLGLRNLDDWRTTHVEQQTTIGGFMGERTEQVQESRRVPVPKLRRAARELSEVAEQLGALSEFDASVPRTEITDELIEEVEEWRQKNLE